MLVDPNNIEDIKDKMVTLLENVELRKKMINTGLIWSENFSWDKASKKIDELLLSLVEGK